LFALCHLHHQEPWLLECPPMFRWHRFVLFLHLPVNLPSGFFPSGITSIAWQTAWQTLASQRDDPLINLVERGPAWDRLVCAFLCFWVWIWLEFWDNLCGSGPYAWVQYTPGQPILPNKPNEGSVKRRNEKKRMRQRRAFILVRSPLTLCKLNFGDFMNVECAFCLHLKKMTTLF